MVVSLEGQGSSFSRRGTIQVIVLRTEQLRHYPCEQKSGFKIKDPFIQL